MDVVGKAKMMSSDEISRIIQSNLKKLASKHPQLLTTLASKEHQCITRPEVDAAPDLFELLVKGGLLRYRTGDVYYINFTHRELQDALKEEERISDGLPADLFSLIEGYDDLKEVFVKSLNADMPVHILLVGAPSTAKTMFLMELERIGGLLTLGGTSTKVKIRDIIMEETPRILVIDELEKINNSKDLSSLLSWMESGRLIVAKHKDYRKRVGKGWVFAAVNTTSGVPEELLSRFLCFHLREYTRDEFIRVAIAVLTKRESITEGLAHYIAINLADKGHRDVRDAIKVGRLSHSERDVDKVIATMIRYRKRV